MKLTPLGPSERARIDGFWPTVADYTELERRGAPTATLTQEFLTSAPPGVDPVSCDRLGLIDADVLIGLTEVAFGFPDPSDAYLGLMLIAAPHRGGGHGAAALRLVEARARSRGATRLCLAVLDANPRGRAFWRREGFTDLLTRRPLTIGCKAHTASRMGKLL